MKDRNNGLILGALLLVFFTVYTLRQDFYLQIVQNYDLVLIRLQAYIPKILLVVIIIIFAKLIISIINPILERYFKIRGKEREFISMSSVVSYVVWIIAMISIISVLLGNIAVWMTSVGLIGFGVTFALQKPILNFVAWVAIMFGKTYIIGDRVMVGEDSGDILEIKMMYTVMDGLLPHSDDPSGKIITFPNELVLTGSITNFTKNGEYIWDGLSVDITYESNWNKAMEALKDVTFKAVNKYVSASTKDQGERHDDLAETIDILKKEHGSTNSSKEKEIIEKRIGEAKDEQDRIEDVRKFAARDVKKDPAIRVELKESSIGLYVRYLAHYREVKKMRSEINSAFLNAIDKMKDVEIAYPHLQIVRKK